jgi:hypothetical protein
VDGSRKIEEFWTESRKAIAITGEWPVIVALAEDLGLAPDSPIPVSGQRYSIALWGDVLEAYLRLRAAGSGHWVSAARDCPSKRLPPEDSQPVAPDSEFL